MSARRCGRGLAAASVALVLGAVLAPGASAKESPHQPKAGNFVAAAAGASVSVYERPDDETPTTTFSNPTATDGKLVFLVERLRSDGWAKVLLPIRPNGSTGWIFVEEVELQYNPYRLVVKLDAHELILFKADDEVMREPVGVGKSSTPTPGGRYYITQLFQPPDPDGPYGPYAYALSGFSEVLTTFKGGEAIVGIHGTNKPQLIGQDVSSGCIRMHNDAITEMRALLPLGTPVTVKA